VDIVAKSLKKHGFNAEPIHGDLDQSHRTRTLDGFRDGTIRFLVASDVAARGLDIPNVSHVFNYDVPSHAEDYVHRIGRTGRAGRTGVAISLAVPADGKYLGAIESLIETEIPRAEAPWSPQERPRRGPSEDEGEDRGPRRRGRARSAPPSEDKASPARAEAEPEETERKPRRDRGERGGRDRDRTGGGRGRDRVVGMGDHLPGFIAMSFDERRGGPARSDDTADDVSDDASDDVTETVTQETANGVDAPPEPDAEKAKPAPKRRRSRAKKTDEAQAIQAGDDPAEAPSADAPSDDAPSDVPSSDKGGEETAA
jgi:superfamily II DNA/RNA helicase